MRGVDKVSEKTKAKVLKAAKEVGYKHSPIVSTVMGHLARTRESEHAAPIALVIDKPNQSDVHKLTTKDMMTRAQARADGLGFKVELFALHENGLTSERLNSILIARGIQGVVLNVASERTAAIELDWEKFCIVTSGGRMDHCRNLHTVRSDAPQVIARVSREARSRGYKRIGFCHFKAVGDAIGGLSESAIFYEQANRPECADIPLLDTVGQPPEVFKEWFNTYKPDAVLSPSNYELQWLHEKGYRVPKDIRYANYGQVDLEDGSDISGIVQYKGELIAAAVELVVTNLLYGRFGPQEKPTRTLLPGQWVEGSTLRKP